jgi:hypothetical protein
MCWTTSVPGASGGIDSRISRIASVPPVEAPMAMTRSVVVRRSGSLVKAGGAGRRERRTRREAKAASTASITCVTDDDQHAEGPRRGLRHEVYTVGITAFRYVATPLSDSACPTNRYPPARSRPASFSTTCALEAASK